MIDIGNSLPEIDDMFDHIMLTSELSWKEKITRKKLEKWLSNFTGEVFNKDYEQQLALWLLVNFVFYNNDEVSHLCKTLYGDFIHHYASNYSYSSSNVDEILTDILDKTMFLGLGRAGESGGFISYLFRKANKLSNRLFVFDPLNLNPNTERIVFIDDVTLSSGKSQAIRYLENDVGNFYGDKEIVLLTLIASEKAIKNLKKKGYEAINCITLSKRDMCFSKKSNAFEIYNDHRNNCKIFAEHYGKKALPSHPLGYKNAQLAFGFFYNTPNNTLPIFWSERNSWQPIIKRYSKNYGQTKFENIGRFV